MGEPQQQAGGMERSQGMPSGWCICVSLGVFLQSESCRGGCSLTYIVRALAMCPSHVSPLQYNHALFLLAALYGGPREARKELMHARP